MQFPSTKIELSPITVQGEVTVDVGMCVHLLIFGGDLGDIGLACMTVDMDVYDEGYDRGIVASIRVAVDNGDGEHTNVVYREANVDLDDDPPTPVQILKKTNLSLNSVRAYAVMYAMAAFNTMRQPIAEAWRQYRTTVMLMKE